MPFFLRVLPISAPQILKKTGLTIQAHELIAGFPHSISTGNYKLMCYRVYYVVLRKKQELRPLCQRGDNSPTHVFHLTFFTNCVECMCPSPTYQPLFVLANVMIYICPTFAWADLSSAMKRKVTLFVCAFHGRSTDRFCACMPSYMYVICHNHPQSAI